MAGNMARTSPTYPADVVFAVVVCILTYLFVGPLLSFFQSFRTKIVSLLFFGIVGFTTAFVLLIFLMFVNIFSDSTPLRVDLHHELITATNESRVAFAWPHPASIDVLKDELTSIGYKPFDCRTYMPYLMEAVCLNVDPLDLARPRYVFEKVGFNEETKEYNYTLTVTCVEPGRIGLQFPSHLTIVFDGHLIDNSARNSVTLNFGDAVDEFKYSLIIGNVEADIEATVLESSHWLSPQLHELVDKLHPRIHPWGSYLLGEVVTVNQVVVHI
ncbi:hypothetical protein GEMRC1_002093 [Eukaryota sp. GEM-RC1]